MFIRKIAPVALVAAVTLAGCDQALSLIGLGSKPSVRATRAPRVERTPGPATLAPTPKIYVPQPDTNAGTATFSPPVFLTPRPDGTIPTPTPATPSLTAEVVELGEGLRELRNFRGTGWNWAASYGGTIEVAAVTTDQAGSVYILAERMCSACYSWFTESYPATLWEGVWKLDSLASASAKFSLVADQAGDEKYVVDSLTISSNFVVYERWKRLVAFRKLGGLATPSIDVLKTVGSSRDPAVLSEDAENRWGATSIPFVGLPYVSWYSEVYEDLGKVADPPLASPMSVGSSTSVIVLSRSSLARTNLVWVFRNGEAIWKSLSVPGTHPDPKNWIRHEYGRWEEYISSWAGSWEYQHTWYSAQWPAETGGHWIWAGNATSPRIWVYPDK